MSERTIIEEPLCLQSGRILPNRIAGAALTEHLANDDGLPNNMHFRLYEAWASSGAAFKLTGNVMVDRRCLEGKGNVILDMHQPLAPFEQWAKTAQKGTTELWMQIGHAGGLSPCPDALSPSGVQHIGIRTFPKPRPMDRDEIRDVIACFKYAAKSAKEVGFTGVEIHSAHGFLLNQFLSPATNKRKDEYGGLLENRMRLLIEVIRETRDAVGSKFPIAVKLNSSDGMNLDRSCSWTEEEAAEVAATIAKEEIDLLETSGGSYDRTIMLGPDNPPPSERPEAFFHRFAQEVRRLAPHLPIMLTGGMRTVATMTDVIRSGVGTVIGLGRPMAAMPDVPRRLLSGAINEIPRFEGDSLPVFEQLQWFQERMRQTALSS